MRRTRLAALAVVDAGVLGGLRGAAEHAARHVCSLSDWFVTAGADRVLGQLAAAALWVVAAWVGLAVVVLLGTALPGLPGTVAAALSRFLTPRAVRHLLAGWAGIGVALAPVAALAAPSAAATAPVAHHATVVSALADSPAHRPRGHRPGGPLPAPTWPGSEGGAPRAQHAAAVTVRRGDCLWLLAARQLAHADGVPVRDVAPARIAAAWPRWYAQNRGVIGTDPAVLQPGEHLHAPQPEGSAP